MAYPFSIHFIYLQARDECSWTKDRILDLRKHPGTELGALDSQAPEGARAQLLFSWLPGTRELLFLSVVWRCGLVWDPPLEKWFCPLQLPTFLTLWRQRDHSLKVRAPSPQRPICTMHTCTTTSKLEKRHQYDPTFLSWFLSHTCGYTPLCVCTGSSVPFQHRSDFRWPPPQWRALLSHHSIPWCDPFQVTLTPTTSCP